MKCPNCGKAIVKYPIKAGDGSIIWKNFFKMDIVSVIFLIAVLLLAYGYSNDTKVCREIMENPCDYSAEVGCCTIDRLVSKDKFVYLTEINDSELNISEG